MTESSVQRTGSTSSTSPDSSARRRFSDEFKRDAVRLVVQESYSFKAAAQAVGVWHRVSARNCLRVNPGLAL